MFHDRPTCARSRSRCSRPERGKSKVPFSACSCHLLVIDYRWGSMGSDETASTIPGAPQKIGVLTGTGRHRAQIAYFFRMQIGSRTPSGIGLGSGSRLRRMHPYLGLSRELWIEIFGKSWSRVLERKGPYLYVCTHGSARPVASGRLRRRDTLGGCACPRLFSLPESGGCFRR